MPEFTLSRSNRLTLPLILFLVALLPSQLWAQAGAYPTISFGASSFQQELALLDSEGGVSVEAAPQLPAGVLRLASDERYLLWVELERGRMHLLERQDDGSMLTRKIIAVSIGKNGFGKEVEGDKLTPVGVYRLTSFLADNTLDDFYGNGAYPLNYPNKHDRLQKRTGHGIWLHGLPKGKDERPLLDSDGCVVIDNDSLVEMAQYIKTGSTYIVLSQEPINWVPSESTKQKEQSIAKAIDTWRSDWESKDNKAYLSHYDAEFSDLKQNKAQWSEYKSRINNGKQFIKVKTSHQTFIADPRDTSLVSVRFYQDYKSSNYNWAGWKEQLWQETEQGWKIIYEGDG